MSCHRPKATFHLCALFFFFFFGFLFPASAEITIEPQIGFHGLFRLGHPFPLRIELGNPGGPLEGMLEIRVWKGGPARGVDFYPVYHRSPVFLSAQSRKSFQFTIDPDSVSRPLLVTFSGAGSRWSKEADLRRHFSPSPLILLISESNLLPPVLLGPSSPGPVVALGLGDLPSDPRAYGGVAAAILYEQSLRDLSRRQASALEGWLSSGGRMLILGSLHYALYQEPTLGRFLPVRVAGLKRLASLPALDRRYGKSAVPLKDLWVQVSRPVEGNVVLEDSGVPVLVETGRGRGKVLYLALDIGRPPLSRWEGLPALFRDLLAALPERAPVVQAAWDEAIFGQLLATPSFISAYVPVRSFFFWMLFYLGGIGVLAWWRRRYRLGWRSVVMWFMLLNAASTAGGTLHFSRRGNVPDGVLLTATVLEALADGYVEAQSNVALFSTQTREYGLLMESGWRSLEARHPNPGTEEEAWVVVQDEGSSARFSFPLREWAYRLFKVRSLGPFSVRVDIEDRGARVMLRVNNLSPKDLAECYFMVRGESFSLGDIPRGSSLAREFALAPQNPLAPEARRSRPDPREIRFASRMREMLFRYSFFSDRQGLSRWGGDGALFFGWVEQPSPRVRIDDGRVLSYDYTLFRAIIPVDEERDL
jgi:hypothetical protein